MFLVYILDEVFYIFEFTNFLFTILQVGVYLILSFNEFIWSFLSISIPFCFHPFLYNFFMMVS